MRILSLKGYGCRLINYAQGNWGDLEVTIGSNGAYSYSGTSEGQDVFKYTIVDQDGDKATANLTITVDDGVTDEDVTVNIPGDYIPN